MKATVKKLHLYLLVPVVVSIGLSLGVAGKTAEAACAANTANLGSVTGSFTVPADGTYRVWSRIQPDATTPANNSYTLEVDSGIVAAGSSTCNITVGDATIAAPPAWTWVDYRDGNTNSKINMFLGAGTHTYTLYGREAGVSLDRIIFASNASCIPSNGPRDPNANPVVDPGDNCAATADTTNPTTAITAPAANATISGTTVSVTASASDSVGVTKVEFYIDGQIIGTADTTAPYAATLNTTSFSNATHVLTSKAYDAAGNFGTSASVSVTINNTVVDTTPPTVSITSPAANAVISAVTPINVTAADAGGISKVEFYIDGQLLNTDTATPFTLQFNPALFANGVHSLTAKAYDNASNNALSAAVSITINNPDTTAPSVVITAPLNNTTVTGPTVINVNASDAGSGVARVDFYIDGTLKNTDTNIPYTYSVDTTTLTNASHTFVVKAIDVAGNISLPATLTLTVNNTIPVKKADFNGDNVVDTQDLFILLPNFSKTVPPNTKGDCNGNGAVDIDDLFILLAQFGK